MTQEQVFFLLERGSQLNEVDWRGYGGWRALR